MKARFGYLENGKFNLLYQGSLYEVDQYTKKHYRNKKDLLKKERLNENVKAVLYCTTNTGKFLYNRAGYALQSTILYGNSKDTDISSMISLIKNYVNVLRPTTHDLNNRFMEFTFAWFPEVFAFPESMDKLLAKLVQAKNNTKEYNKLTTQTYYYFIKQASITYQKEAKNIKKEMECLPPKDTLNIELKQGSLTIHGENVYEFLEDCLLKNDQEEFWNIASLDDLRIITLKNKQFRKDPKN